MSLLIESDYPHYGTITFVLNHYMVHVITHNLTIYYDFDWELIPTRT